MPAIISIHSFRGGTGKSNTTANLAAMLASKGQRVCVIDADLQSPGIRVPVGLEGERGNNVASDPAVIARLSGLARCPRILDAAKRWDTPCSPGKMTIGASLTAPVARWHCVRRAFLSGS
jgi:Mrp family chromosome partitioning ATPase